MSINALHSDVSLSPTKQIMNTLLISKLSNAIISYLFKVIHVYYIYGIQGNSAYSGMVPKVPKAMYMMRDGNNHFSIRQQDIKIWLSNTCAHFSCPNKNRK